MQADPVDLHAPAVEMEAVVGRELERADAERGLRSTPFPSLLKRWSWPCTASGWPRPSVRLAIVERLDNFV